MLWTVIGFVLLVSGEGKFFVHAETFTDFAECDEFADLWADAKSTEADIDTVWSQCVPLPAGGKSL